MCIITKVIPPAFPSTDLPLVQQLSPIPPRPSLFHTQCSYVFTVIEWVQDTVTASSKWGDIGDWDVSGVGDFSYAFSSYRNQAGGSRVNDGNPKAATFVGAAMSKWITTSVTTLKYTFRGAVGMNADLSGWNVAKVTSLEHTFKSSKFKGTGLSSWITTSVTTLRNTFWEAVEVDADLSGWNVAKVTTLEGTFGRAAMFEGTGLKSWDIASVTTLSKTFMSTTSLTTCNKRKIADAWKSSAVFVATSYGTDWAGETCPKVRDDCEERCGAMCRSRVCMRCRTLLVQMRTVVCKVERIVSSETAADPPPAPAFPPFSRHPS